MFRLPSYSAPSSDNIKIVKFTPLSSENGNVAVLSQPRLSFGQALANLINGWAEKIKASVEKRRQEFRNAKQEITDLKETIAKRDEKLAEEDDEISSLKKECSDLSEQLEKQKQLVAAAAKPTKTFAQGLDEMLRKQYTNKSAAPKQQNKNPTKPKL